MKTLTIFILFFVSLSPYGQGKFVTKIYYAQTIADSWYNSRRWHYVLQVFNDSSVSLDMYNRCNKYMSIQFSKNTFTGNAHMIDDTLKVAWTINSFMTVANYQPILKREEPISIEGHAFLPSTVFVLKNHAALTAGDIFPLMKEISFEELILFEDKFDEWVRINDKSFHKELTSSKYLPQQF